MRFAVAGVVVAVAVAGAALAGGLGRSDAGTIDRANRQGPFSSYEFTIAGTWAGPVGNREYVAFTGSFMDIGGGKPVQGGVRVISVPLDREAPNFGHVLTLATGAGQIVEFDVAKLRFVRGCRQDGRC